MAIAQAGGWLPFDRFMAMALYEPGLGYYANARRKFGWMPGSGSDFVTAPELSALFGRALAVQVAEALRHSGTTEVVEFGAGSGALAATLIEALDAAGAPLTRYTIVDLSGTLKARQAERLAPYLDRVVWQSQWPQTIRGVVVANELLDAMPVQLLYFDGSQWFERGVALGDGAADAPALVFADRPTTRRPPEAAAFVPGTVTEIHPQAEAFITSLADHLHRGVAFFIDYGFPQAEYYLPQRVGGTLMCHHLHRADPDPLQQVGEKDITAHVNFTAMALAGQDAGLHVVGYTSQARFLINCGIAALMAQADVAERAMAQRLITEHEMGELFKVLALASADLPDYVPLGFASGDRMHRL